MSQEPEAAEVREPGAPLWVVGLLLVLTVVVPLIIAVGVFVQVYAYVRHPAPIEPTQVLMQWIQLAAVLVVGLAVGALLLAVATLLKYWHTGLRSLLRLEEATGRLAARLEAGASIDSGARPAPSAKPLPEPSLDAQTVQTMLALLGDIRDNTLLNEDQRRAKLERLMAEHRRNLIAQVQTMTAQGKFLRAEHILQDLVRRFGSDAEFDRLAVLINEARARIEKQQIEAAKRKLTDLLSVNAWDRAEEVTTELLEQQPNSLEARELAEHVRTEKNRFQEQQRLRLFADIEKHTTRREWQAALQSARLLLRLYPESSEAETLKPQIATLEANAEIALRQGLEAQIKELVKQQRYADAVEIAERLVRDYPASPQAEALRDQLPKLRSLAGDISQSLTA